MPYRLGWVKMGLGLTGKLGRAWVGAWDGAWVGAWHGAWHGMVVGAWGHGEEVIAPCHALTHARPSLPVNPNPILTPPNTGPVALHDTAAILQWNKTTLKARKPPMETTKFGK